MVEYICERCAKKFNKKSNYIAHLSRKNLCKSICNDNKAQKNAQKAGKNSRNEEEKAFFCDNCNKYFLKKYNCERHQKTCKIKNNENLEKLYKELLKEMKKQNKEIKMLKEQLYKPKTETKINAKNICNNNNINSNNTTNNNFVNIVAFGKEDIKYISKQEWIKLLNMKYMSVKGLIEKIHFNDKYPENSNVYISNLKDNYAMFYNGNKWIIETKNEVISNLIDTKTEHLENKFFEIINDLPKIVKQKFKEFLENNDDDSYLNNLKNEIKLMLYNKKNIPMKIIKDNEKALIYA
jgi:hypothetical protein